jgi:intraflagellar transport protein 46
MVPDYIPTIGEVDAFLKMPKPDEKEETLGLVVLVII